MTERLALCDSKPKYFSEDGFSVRMYATKNENVLVDIYICTIHWPLKGVKVECWEIVRRLIYIVCSSSHLKPVSPTLPLTQSSIHPSIYSSHPIQTHPPSHPLTPVEWMIKRKASGKSGPEDTLRELFYNNKAHFCGFWGTRHRNRLRHRVTSWKVAWSIAREVIWFFNWPDLSNRAVALKYNQPITNMSAR
jgi:hypothetical protein